MANQSIQAWYNPCNNPCLQAWRCAEAFSTVCILYHFGQANCESANCDYVMVKWTVHQL
jgi:hypothetical protein